MERREFLYACVAVIGTPGLAMAENPAPEGSTLEAPLEKQCSKACMAASKIKKRITIEMPNLDYIFSVKKNVLTCEIYSLESRSYVRLRDIEFTGQFHSWELSSGARSKLTGDAAKGVRGGNQVVDQFYQQRYDEALNILLDFYKNGARYHRPHRRPAPRSLLWPTFNDSTSRGIMQGK